MSSVSFVSFFILDSGITVGIFPGTIYTDIDSPTLDHTHVSHSHTFLALSASGRYTKIIHQDMERLHVTEYIPSCYKQKMQLLLEYRTLYISAKQSLYLNSRYFSSVSIPLKELSPSSSSLWLIYTNENSIKIDNFGWKILAEDLSGHFLSICPFSLRLRLCWAKPVSSPLSSSTSSKSPVYFGVDYCEFQVIETIFSGDTSGPVLTLVKSLYRHAFQNQFRSSSYHSIMIPFYCDKREDSIYGDNLLEYELKQLEEMVPYLSTVQVHHQVTSRTAEPSSKENDFVGCINFTNSYLRSHFFRIHDVDICYFQDKCSVTGSNDIVLHMMLPFIFPILSKDDFPLLKSMQENQETPVAVAWSSLNFDSDKHSDTQYVVLVWEELIQLYFYHNNQNNGVRPADRLISFSLHRDMIASFVSSQLTHAADDTDTSLLVNVPQTTSDAIQWISHWCICKPSLTQLLLFKGRSITSQNSQTPSRQSTPEETVETIEGNNRTKFSVFHRDSNIYRVRALYRLNQTIIDFDISKNIFTCWLPDGSVQTFTRSQYEDVVAMQQGDDQDHNLYLPVSPQLVVQLLACLRHCHQKNYRRTASHADNGFVLQTLSERQQAQAQERLQEEQEMKRLAHERYLKRLCQATLHQTQMQEYFYRNVYTTAMGITPSKDTASEDVSHRINIQTYNNYSTINDDSNNLEVYETADQRYLRERCELQQRLAAEQEQHRWSVTQHALCLQKVRDALQQCQELARLTSETQTRLNLATLTDRKLLSADEVV